MEMLIFLEGRSGLSFPTAAMKRKSTEEVSKGVEVVDDNKISPESNSPVSSAVVKLLTATRLPAKHGKTVREVHVCDFVEKGIAVFEPCKSMIAERDVMIDDVVTEPDVAQCVTLLISTTECCQYNLKREK